MAEVARSVRVTNLHRTILITGRRCLLTGRVVQRKHGLLPKEVANAGVRYYRVTQALGGTIVFTRLRLSNNRLAVILGHA